MVTAREGRFGRESEQELCHPVFAIPAMIPELEACEQTHPEAFKGHSGQVEHGRPKDDERS